MSKSGEVSHLQDFAEASGTAELCLMLPEYCKTFNSYLLSVCLLSGRQGFNPGQVILKTQKMILDASLFNTQNYKLRIKGKWSNPEKGVAPSPTPLCSCYWTGSFWVILQSGILISLYHYCSCLNCTRMVLGIN